MKEYLITLLTASVLGGIVSVLVSGSSYEKYIKYITGLVCVVIIIAPLKSFISAPFKLPDEYTSASESTVSATGADEVIASLTISEIETYIKDILFNEFGIKVPLTNIKIDWVDDCMVINEIIVYLNNADSKYLTDVKEYLTDTIDKSVSVKILDNTA